MANAPLRLPPPWSTYLKEGGGSGSAIAGTHKRWGRGPGSNEKQALGATCRLPASFAAALYNACFPWDDKFGAAGLQVVSQSRLRPSSSGTEIPTHRAVSLNTRSMGTMPLEVPLVPRM